MPMSQNRGPEIKKVIIQDYNLKELAAIYNLSKYLLRNKMKSYEDQIGKRTGYEYSPAQVELIFRLVKLPSHIQIVKARNTQ